MQGSVLNAESGRYLILGDDGVRYTFALSEWRAGDIAPEVGVRVDFVAKDNDAVDIFPIPEPATAQPTPTPAESPATTPAGSQITPTPPVSEGLGARFRNIGAEINSAAAEIDWGGLKVATLDYVRSVRDKVGNIGIIIAGVVLIVISLVIRTDVFATILDYAGILGIVLGLFAAVFGVFLLGKEKNWWGKASEMGRKAREAAESLRQSPGPTEPPASNTGTPYGPPSEPQASSMEAPYQYPTEPQAPSAEPRYQYPAQSADPSTGTPYEQPIEPPASSTETPYQYPTEPQAPIAEPRHGYAAQSGDPGAQATYEVPAEPQIENVQSQIPPQPVATPPPAAVSSASPRPTITHAKIPIYAWIFAGLTVVLLIFAALPITPWFALDLRDPRLLGESSNLSLWGAIDPVHDTILWLLIRRSDYFSEYFKMGPLVTAYVLVWVAVTLTLAAMVYQHLCSSEDPKVYKRRSEKIFGLFVLAGGYGIMAMVFCLLYTRIEFVRFDFEPSLGWYSSILAMFSLICWLLSLIKYANDIGLFDRLDPTSLLGSKSFAGGIRIGTFWLLTCVIVPILIALFISNLWSMTHYYDYITYETVGYETEVDNDLIIDSREFAQTGSMAPIELIDIVIDWVFGAEHRYDDEYPLPMAIIFSAILCVWGFACMRRWRDRGRSGWLALASLIPVVYFLDGWLSLNVINDVANWWWSLSSSFGWEVSPELGEQVMGVLTAGLFVWSVVELGFLGSSSTTNREVYAVGETTGNPSAGGGVANEVDTAQSLKNCPYCAEMISYEATTCPFCQSELGNS